MKIDKKTQGKKSRESGQRFEIKVRKDLESKGWIVDRWSNNVEITVFVTPDERNKPISNDRKRHGKLIPAKSRFGLRTTGFPDFIAFSEKWHLIKSLELLESSIPKGLKIIFGIECKSNGYLDKEEKEKCKWLLDNNVFSKILIASKSKKRGEIKYEEFDNDKINL